MGWETNFKRNKKKYIELAQELCYKKKYIDKLKSAQSEDEIQRILIDARRDSR